MTAQPLTYARYLRLDDLLSCQQPLTDEHDELLFVVIHQVYELWFKQILHETAQMQRRLEDGNVAAALHTARRIAKILKTIVGQLDVLETMTPAQFAAFRPELGSASGFQSSQFRQIEARYGRRDFGAVEPELEPVLAERTVFDSLLRLLARRYDLPREILDRDPRRAWEGDPLVEAALREVYHGDLNDPPHGADTGSTGGPGSPGSTAGTSSAGSTGSAAQLEMCEALVDIDEGLQEWRYRHVKMVERIIGARIGTGGSAGAAYLRATLFRPVFPDLWAVRSS